MMELLGSAWLGSLAFAATFGLLVIFLWMIPDEQLGYDKSKPPAYRNVRYWAVGIALAQMGIYLFLGTT